MAGCDPWKACASSRWSTPWRRRYARRHLADLGAEVIKIERPGDGDFARSYDNYVKGICSHFIWLNRGKRSVTLDVKNPDARASWTH